MVRVCRAAIDMLQEQSFNSEELWALGYGVGSLVGQHVGALDPCVQGLVAVSMPASFRSATGTSNVLAKCDLLLPWLGFYLGNKPALPYDIEDLMDACAPRWLLVVSLRHDRLTLLEEITVAVKCARQRVGDDAIEQLVTETYNHFGLEHQDAVTEWMQGRSSAGN